MHKSGFFLESIEFNKFKMNWWVNCSIAKYKYDRNRYVQYSLKPNDRCSSSVYILAKFHTKIVKSKQGTEKFLAYL